MKTLRRIVKDLSGRSQTQTVQVKNLDGTTASTHEEQQRRWRQHFKLVLNGPEPEIQFDFNNEATTELHIDRNSISIDEIHKAITSLTSGKSPGIYGLRPEILKAGGSIASTNLPGTGTEGGSIASTNLPGTVWESEKIPTDCCVSIIIPLPKKGDKNTGHANKKYPPIVSCR